MTKPTMRETVEAMWEGLDTYEVQRALHEAALARADEMDKMAAQLAAVTKERDAARAGCKLAVEKWMAWDEKLAAVTAERDKLLADHQWRPIDTAPKDGTEVLLFRADCGVVIGLWSCPAEQMSDCDLETSSLTEDEAYACEWWTQDGHQFEDATHWKPITLPEGE